MTIASGRVMVLSDDERVSAVVEMATKPILETTILSTKALLRAGPSVTDPCDYALIILALSAYQSEPVVVLARASMAAQIGRVPLLIISDRAFPSDPSTRITHMDFPFTVSQLTAQIRSILEGTVVAVDCCRVGGDPSPSA